LLLEAGGRDGSAAFAIPAAFPKLFGGRHDWAYQTEPQAHADGRRIPWPRGKVLGGSSAINAMIYTRGNRADYDGWRDGGAAGWGYEEVLPYFKRAEHQERGASAYHGVGGPLNVADQRHVNPLSRAFVEAGVEIGLPRVADFNDAAQEGVGCYQVTQRGGRRQSAATAYLRPARHRRNLTVVTAARATRILVAQGRATGVAYVRDGRVAEVRAEREVLLCGGTINSPQLLLLSGVGPADELRAQGIESVADLPGVGRNLHDHPGVPVVYTSRLPVSLANAARPGAVLRYLFGGQGPLTSNLAEAGGFVTITPEAPAPEVQFHFSPAALAAHGAGRHGFTIGPTLLCPRSRGMLTLRSANPFVPPRIDPNYLADDADLRVLVAGIHLARRIAGARAFDHFRGAEVLPGSTMRRDEELAAYVRRTLGTLFHPVGTCKMGAAGDPLVVVDASLRVRGLAGLRVVDASVMPTIIGGNTNAPAIMIAEKAADMIRGADERGAPATLAGGGDADGRGPGGA
jgi:choline dehydrogenase-like flavoprotein